MIKDAIYLLSQGKKLSEEDMAASMKDIMEGFATDAQVSSFLTVLRMKPDLFPIWKLRHEIEKIRLTAL